MFQNMGPSPSGRSGHAMASIGTKVYILGGKSFSPSESSDPSINHVLDTSEVHISLCSKIVIIYYSLLEHIKYPQDNEGPPASAVPTSSPNAARRPSVTQNPQNAPQFRQGHPPNISGRSMSPSVALERAISLVGFGPVVANSNSTIAGNGKGKAPVRPKRKDNKFNAQEGGYDTVNFEPFGMRERMVSHDRKTHANSMTQANMPSRAVASHALSMIGVSMGINNRTSAAVTGWASPITQGASPTFERPKLRGESDSAVAPKSMSNESVQPASRRGDGSVGIVSADLIRDLEVKDVELDNLKREMARMKEVLANATRAGYVQTEIEDSPELVDEPPPYS